MRKALLFFFALATACSSPESDDDETPIMSEMPTHPASTRTVAKGSLPATSIDGERIAFEGIDMRAFRAIDDHQRWKVVCTFDVAREVHLCVTDGTRLFTIDRNFQVSEEKVSDQLFSSYLWGDFDDDGRPDFIAFRDGEELWDPATQPTVMLFSNAHGPPRALPFAYAAKAGAVLDADGDGCADVLVLGSGIEKDVEKGDVTYFDDALFAGDCHGGFRAMPWPKTAGGPKLGRTAALTDLDGDGCVDVVVGNYRGFANDVVMGDCHGTFVPDAKHPAVGQKKEGGFYGHTVALVPYDLDSQGVLDLAVANLWHPDDRGSLTDEAHVLVDGSQRREPMPYFLEAPFGFAIADLDQDGQAEWLFATGERWAAYRGAAAVTRRGGDPKKPAWKDAKGWLTMREAPATIDVDMNGCPEWIGDSRMFANYSECGRFIGFVVDGLASLARVTLDDGTSRAIALNGSNEFAIALGGANATTLEIGSRTFDIASFDANRYHVVTLRK